MFAFGKQVIITNKKSVWYGELGLVSGVFPSDILPVEVYVYEQERFVYFSYNELEVI